MVDFEIRNNLKESYMIMNILANDLITYQYRMLDKFSIPHMMRMSSLYEDDKQVQYYHINNMDSLEFCMKEQTFTYESLSMLIKHLLICVDGCKAYMLEEERLDLRPEFIYYHRLDEQFYFMYRPLLHHNESLKEQCFRLFDYLMVHVSNKDQKSMSMCHRLRIAVENERLNTDEVAMILEDLEQTTFSNSVRTKPNSTKMEDHKIKDGFLNRFRKRWVGRAAYEKE